MLVALGLPGASGCGQRGPLVLPPPQEVPRPRPPRDPGASVPSVPRAGELAVPPSSTGTPPRTPPSGLRPATTLTPPAPHER